MKGVNMEEKITILEALKIWDEKYPQRSVTKQTLYNWVKKYNLGSKPFPELRTVSFEVDKNKFVDFINKLGE